MRLLQLILWLGTGLFCEIALAATAEWSVVDGVDVRQEAQPQAISFSNTVVPDKFVTADVARGDLRAVPQGLVTYRWKPAVSDCSVMGVTISTAGTAWALGHLDSGTWQNLAQVGIPSLDPTIAVPRESVRVIPLGALKAGPCTLYIVVSNHHYGHGGLWREPAIAPLREAELSYRRGLAVSTVVFATLFIAGIYHLLLGALKGHDEASRYFGWLSLVLALRQGTSSFGVLDAWIARDLDWSYTFFQYAAFLSMNIVPFFLTRYMDALFPFLLPKWFRRATDIVFGGVSLYLLIVSVDLFDRVLPIFHLSVVLYSIFVLGSFCRYLRGSDWMLKSWVGSLAILMLGAFADIAMVTLGFGDQFLLAYGFLGFIGMQSYLIARRFDGYLSESRELATSLRESLDEREKVEGQLHELEDKLESYAEELKSTGQMLVQSQKLAGLGELVASIGHDIGNPLHSLQLGLESRSSREESILEALKSILDDSDDAQAFLNHVMPHFESLREEREVAGVSLTRLDALSMALRRSARLDAELEVFDLHQVMSDSLLITSHRLKTFEVDVVMDSYGILLGHASHIGQVFTNLLTNAADAIGEKTEGALRIRIFDEERDGSLYLGVTIEDSGPGIQPELLEKVVEIFFTTKPSGKGTGLGLAITKRVLDEHEGTMTLGQSDALGGARVHLLFPRRDEVRTLSRSPVVSKG